jgi:hypothetical protein
VFVGSRRSKTVRFFPHIPRSSKSAVTRQASAGLD